MTHLIFDNWQRKGIALICAIVVWVFVNHSIIETKTIPSIPVRVDHLPSDKTIIGLQPNGYLGRRITLTLSGTKDVIQELESGDLEVIVDASTANSDEWVVQISKKNLVSLNPAIDLSHHITHITQPELVIKLSDLVQERIPIRVMPPTGSPPPGYEYLDVWPQTLMQTVSGPVEEIDRLKEEGLQLTFNLNEIHANDLTGHNILYHKQHDDEISFLIPNKWKKIEIPFRKNVQEKINDPDAKFMRIDFLKKKLIPLDMPLPITVFYPLSSSVELNPKTYSLALSNEIQEKNDLTVLELPLYALEVSSLFLDLVKNNLLIEIIAAPKSEREVLQWSLEIINQKELEDTYLAFLISNQTSQHGAPASVTKEREELLRKRFQDYVRKLTLYVSKNHKLSLRSVLNDGKISVTSE